MSIRIIEIISKKGSDDIGKWYAEKVRKCTHFLVNKAKNQLISAQKPVNTKKKELEVMVK